MLRFIFLALTFLTLTVGCSINNATLAGDVHDPNEAFNRDMDALNTKIDDVILEPVGRVYTKLPLGVRGMISNFAKWTSYPSTSLNSTLQGKYENAALGVINFLVNGLTLGLADLIGHGNKPTREDFGQTLAVWSVPQGDYLVLPLLGPGSPRSHMGFVVDGFINPLGFLATSEGETIRSVGAASSIASFRGNNFKRINDVKYNAPDPYARTRAIYLQFRQGQLTDNALEANPQNNDAFDTFLDDIE